LRDLAAVDRGNFLTLAALPRERAFVLRDLAGFATRRCLGALFEIALALLAAFRMVFFAAGPMGRLAAAAFPTRAPATPPTTAPTGPIMLPTAAPATAPAVSFGIDGISMFSAPCRSSLFCASESSGINGEAPSYVDSEDISAAASETAVNKFEFPAERSAVQKKRPLGGRFLQLLMASSLAAIAATTTVTTAAAIAAAAATTAVTASATAGWPRLSRACLIYSQWATLNGLAVEFRNGVLSVLFRTHRDKSKATRLAGEFILHESDFLHGASL
jgi:hypothetical protein